MKPLSYTHPTFNHFLQFHLGPFMFESDHATDILTSQQIIRMLGKNGFPFKDARLGADVHIIDDTGNPVGGITLMCAKGEPTTSVIHLLSNNMLTDRDINRERNYGPIVIECLDHHDAFVTYYDQVVRDIFTNSVGQSLYTDPTTMKTSWYGQVNAYNQERYLEKIVTQLVNLRGISKLFATHLNTKRGGMVLTDSARASSLAVSLMKQINPHASDYVIYTIGFACFVQHFGALFNSAEEYYPGKIYEAPNKATLEILAHLGINIHNENALPNLQVNVQDVLRILCYTGDPSKKDGSRNMALIHCFTIVNQIVATYFTSQKRVRKESGMVLEYNPGYRNVSNTMDGLDAAFDGVLFYRYHREKIERYIRNADRYYNMHIRNKMNTGGFVSDNERDAITTRRFGKRAKEKS